MALKHIREDIKKGCYDKDFSLLYSSVDCARARYLEAVDEFEKLYGDAENILLFSAPGRTEVGGNHTDHQHGCVLAGSVDLDVIAVVALSSENTVKIQSKGYQMDVIDLDLLEPQELEIGRAASLIRGMCGIVKENGYKVGGFNAYTTSNVLKGSGLSSSAAFEVLVGVILNNLFNDGKISPVDIAKFAQKAENVYFGKPCGLMDQMASSVGGFTAMDFGDTANPVIEKVDFSLAEQGHSLCIINTGGNHANLTDDYAAITKDCREVSQALGKEFLREVNEVDFYNNLGKLRSTCSDRALLRAMHFFADNNRVFLEKEALKNKNFNEFLRVVNESGNSSFKFLQNVFSVTAPLEQGLSLALALTERFLKGRGACRVHGGGFAGTIQVFIPNDILDDYKTMIESVFGKGNCYVLNIRPVGGYALTKN